MDACGLVRFSFYVHKSSVQSGFLDLHSSIQANFVPHEGLYGSLKSGALKISRLEENEVGNSFFCSDRLEIFTEVS